MHIYHYASYERTHLLSIAARHGVGEHIVDDLLRDGVLVDLYSTVKKSLRVGGRSYSIKKLEPLYMGAEHRADDGVTNAAASIEEYERAMEARASGDEAEAQQILDTIADYNEYDCVSTRRLRNWLLEQAAKVGVAPGAHEEEEIPGDPFEPSALNLELLRRAETSDDAQDAAANALAAAAIDYHRRENKSFWWEHFARLTEPIDHWADTRGVFMIDRVDRRGRLGSHGRQRNMRRRLRAEGTWAPGSGTPQGDAFALYGHPVPFRKKGRRPGSLLDVGVKIVADPEDGVVWIDEVCPGDEDLWSVLPLAITPGPAAESGQHRRRDRGVGRQRGRARRRVAARRGIRHPDRPPTARCRARTAARRRRQRARRHHEPARARQLLPRRAGAARHRQNIPRRACDHRARARPRLAHRRRRAIAQGRRERAAQSGGCRAGARSRRQGARRRPRLLRRRAVHRAAEGWAGRVRGGARPAAM